MQLACSCSERRCSTERVSLVLIVSSVDNPGDEEREIYSVDNSAIYRVARESSVIVSRDVHKEVANNNGHCLHREVPNEVGPLCVLGFETKKSVRDKAIVRQKLSVSVSVQFGQCHCAENTENKQAVARKALCLMP